jgi:hypothetical protein
VVLSGEETSSKTTGQEPNTIILEFSGAKSEDLRDLRNSEGKLFKKIALMIEKLKESGEVTENVQPVIVIVKKKSSKKGLLD